VIVDLDRIFVRGSAALALFPTVASEIAVWPGFRILVAARDANQRVLAESRLGQHSIRGGGKVVWAVP
jgi:hypothetical protein